eukprot:SAG31_NODE_11015_length_1074_cov_1.027692_1_plen_218_part_01
MHVLVDASVSTLKHRLYSISADAASKHGCALPPVAACAIAIAHYREYVRQGYEGSDQLCEDATCLADHVLVRFCRATNRRLKLALVEKTLAEAKRKHARREEIARLVGLAHIQDANTSEEVQQFRRTHRNLRLERFSPRGTTAVLQTPTRVATVAGKSKFDLPGQAVERVEVGPASSNLKTDRWFELEYTFVQTAGDPKSRNGEGYGHSETFVQLCDH